MKFEQMTAHNMCYTDQTTLMIYWWPCHSFGPDALSHRSIDHPVARLYWLKCKLSTSISPATAVLITLMIVCLGSDASCLFKETQLFWATCHKSILANIHTVSQTQDCCSTCCKSVWTQIRNVFLTRHRSIQQPAAGLPGPRSTLSHDKALFSILSQSCLGPANKNNNHC